MHDPVVVSMLRGAGNLFHNRNDLAQRKRSLIQPRLQIDTVDEVHHNEIVTGREPPQSLNAYDVRVMQFG